jgi:hypothetical protein
MKKIALSLFMLVMAFSAMADGWIYENDGAGIESGYEYVTGNYDRPTVLRVFVMKDENKKNIVLCVLEGECTTHNFRKNQQYVKVEFGWGDSQKWTIKEVPFEGSNYQAFQIVNATRFITKLKKAEYFEIVLPLYGHGTQDFHFSANGYPLDW